MNNKKHLPHTGATAVASRMRTALLSVLLTAATATALLSSCSADPMDASQTTAPGTSQNPIQLNIGLPQPPAFDAGTASRAIGTPDNGKTTWTDGDKLMVQLTLNNAAATKSLNLYFATTYSGTAWNIDVTSLKAVKYDGTAYTNITGTDTDAAIKFLTATGTITLPVDCQDCNETYTATYHYAPGQEWQMQTNNSCTLTFAGTADEAAKQYGMHEQWSITTSAATPIEAGVAIGNMSGGTWSTTASRLRISALPGDQVTFTSEAGFTPAGSTGNVANFTATATADAKGNVFFYGTWTSGCKMNVGLNGDASTNGNTETVFVKTWSAASEIGKSYAIDALENASGQDNLKVTAMITVTAGGNTTADLTGKTNWFVSKADATVTDDDVIKVVQSNLPANGTADGTLYIVLSDVKSVPDEAFYNNKNGYKALKSLSAPAATTIGDYAFRACTGLTSLNLPVATSIGNYAFSGCSGLTSLNLPVATSIGNYAFSGCIGLTSLKLPVATTIGESAFYYCSALTSLDLPVAASIDTYAFYYCSALTSLDLPAATSIGEYAFFGCSKLTSLKLPFAASIGTSAFYNCSALTSLNLPAAATIGNNAFYGCSALTSLDLPVATTIGGNAFDGCSGLTSLNLPVATTIGTSAFNACSGLTSLNLPVATTIGNFAFSDCSKLTTLTFGKAITSWGCYVLSYATPANITLTLATDQKASTGGGDTFDSATFGTENFFHDGADVSKEFCGYTFKEIKQGTAATK